MSCKTSLYKPPKRGKRFQEILEEGCGGYYDRFGEFDCLHNYTWDCIDCPVMVGTDDNKDEPPIPLVFDDETEQK